MRFNLDRTWSLIDAETAEQRRSRYPAQGRANPTPNSASRLRGVETAGSVRRGRAGNGRIVGLGEEAEHQAEFGNQRRLAIHKQWPKRFWVSTTFQVMSDARLTPSAPTGRSAGAHASSVQKDSRFIRSLSVVLSAGPTAHGKPQNGRPHHFPQGWA